MYSPSSANAGTISHGGMLAKRSSLTVSITFCRSSGVSLFIGLEWSAYARLLGGAWKDLKKKNVSFLKKEFR